MRLISVSKGDLYSFTDWLDRYVQVGVFVEEAQKQFRANTRYVSILRDLEVTPQSPPYHAEGPFVSDGVIRALAGLLAVLDEASLLCIEELVRERHLLEEIRDLERIIKEHAASLSVYIFMHDIAKPRTLVLDTPKGSRGEAEGFSVHDANKNRVSSPRERELYSKLFRAHEARQSLDKKFSVASFFDTYEIHAHYPNHGKKGLEVAGAHFDMLSDQFRLRPRERELVAFAILNHMEAIERFGKKDNKIAFEKLISKSHKAGLDANNVFDFMLAAVFFDACVGSLPYIEGRFEPSVELVLRMLRAQDDFAPSRRVARRKRIEEQEELFLRDVLRRTGLDGDSVFALVQMPFGSKRGKVLQAIRFAVTHPRRDVKLPIASHELMVRIEKARKLFDEHSQS